MRQPLVDAETPERHRSFPYKPTFVCLGLLVLATAVTIIAVNRDALTETGFNTCDIFCQGPVLAAMQTSGFFNDSKTYVDIPLVKNPSDVMMDFFWLGSDNLTEFYQTDYDYIGGAGSDVLNWVPGDYNDNPAFLNGITNTTYKVWGQAVNAIWKELGKNLSKDVYDNPSRHTLLTLKHPQMIVPGGRFREFYYWDTYWIVRGLLVCGMTTTVQTILDNFLDFISRYGMIPNGSRDYYLTRSQPPFVTLMVAAYFNATGDTTFLQSALPILDKEYQFWMKSGEHAVEVSDSTGKSYTLNRYYSNTNLPRPESYTEDVATAAGLSESDAAVLYNHIAAAAESGWDFSSRWFADSQNLNTINTMDVIPPDLNAIMCRVESTLASLYSIVGNANQSDFYNQARTKRTSALSAILFDPSANHWRDYNWRNQSFTQTQSVANFIPLWTNCYDTSLAPSVLQALQNSQLVLSGGLTSTLRPTGQQWDFPNAWPPLQHMIIEGLDALSDQNSQDYAFQLASTWLASNYIAFNRTGFMFEKYDATTPGGTGGGGEYDLQAGFGWTNGVVLALLDRYGSQL